MSRTAPKQNAGDIRGPVRQDGVLGWLRARRDADGKPMIGDVAYAAGERLRRDFGLAALGGFGGMRWDGAIASGNPAHKVDPLGGPGPAARDRVARALEAVGPELSGPLIDVCGLDRGLPEMERRRGWPARSGKVVLGLALDALARHYGLSRKAVGAGATATGHWGASDFRPRAT